jgi:ribosomal protein L11 methyltransferase
MVLDLAEPSALGARRFDLLFANLTGGLLQRFAPTLAARLLDGGALIISGVTADEEPDVMRAFTAAGLTATARLQEREWIGATFRSTARSTPA